MSVQYNTSLDNNGLVAFLDARNPQSQTSQINKNDHGLSEWACVADGNVNYSTIYPSTTIYQKTNLGTITTVLTTSATAPESGIFAATAGFTYYASNPIHFLGYDDAAYRIIPLTLAGTSFGWAANRSIAPGQVYIYSPYGNANVEFYQNNLDGCNGNPTTRTVVNQKTVSTAIQYTQFSTTLLYGYYVIRSDIPIVVGIVGDLSVDHDILSPTSNYNYNRYEQYYGSATQVGAGSGTWGGVNNLEAPLNCVFYNTINPTWTITIADGAGGNCAVGLGLEYLSNRYTFGQVLSDFTIVSPSNNVVTTSYWDTATSAWVVWDTQTFTGTITTLSLTNPMRQIRDGNAGPGVEGTAISGGAAPMAGGATCWKWEGNYPFMINVNDYIDDEIALFGWMAEKSAIYPTWTDLTGNGNNFYLTGSPAYTSGNAGYYTFNGTTQDAYLPDDPDLYFLGTQSYTLETWIYPITKPALSNFSGIINREGNFNGARNGYNMWISNEGGVSYIATERFGTGWAGSGDIAKASVADADLYGKWQHIVGVFNSSAATISLYRNGQLANSASLGALLPITNDLRAVQIANRNGQRLNCRVGSARFYNTALSATQVLNNFDSSRSRYGV